MKYPYSDDYMLFDELTNRYVLTEKALLSRGINIRAETAETDTVTPEAVIENLVRLASDMIYAFIHQHSANNMLQDCLIAQVPSLRPIIYRVMLYQAVYVYQNGNLYLSTGENERKKAIDPLAVQELGLTVPELGTSILYSGV